MSGKMSIYNNCTEVKDMSGSLRNTVLGISVAYIAAGLVQIIWPVGSYTFMCCIIGAALTLLGIYHIVRYFRADADYMFGTMGFALGIGCAIAGILLLICAKAIVTVFGVLMALMLIAAGIIKLQLYFNMRRALMPTRLPVLIFALIVLIAGIVLVFDPIKSAATAATVVGICMCTDGIMSLISLILAKDMMRE